jgi:DNA-binding transcriptional regulator YbjK
MVERMDIERRQAILRDAAVRVVETRGWDALTHLRVAQAAKCSESTVYKWASNRKLLRERVLSYARDRGLMTLLDSARAASI